MIRVLWSCWGLWFKQFDSFVEQEQHTESIFRICLLCACGILYNWNMLFIAPTSAIIENGNCQAKKDIHTYGRHKLNNVCS